MQISLISLSPLSFLSVKVGDKVHIGLKRANRFEFREKIGAAQDCFLVFKGATKIGMVPIGFSNLNRDLFLKSVWTVSGVDKESSTLTICCQEARVSAVKSTVNM
jgi:hypothetical protein